MSSKNNNPIYWKQKMAETKTQKSKIFILINKTPSFIKTVIVISGLLLCGYWWFTYRGLYRLLAEIQLKIFSSYAQILTGALTVLIVVIFLIYPIIILAGYLFRNRVIKQESNSSLNAAEKIQKIHDTDQRKFVGMTFVIAGFVIFACVGLYFLIKSLSYGNLVHINVEDVAHKSDFSPRYVVLKAKVLKEVKFGIKNSRYGITYYLPMFSTEKSGRILTGVFLKISQYSFNRLTNGESFKGTLEKNALPGMIRVKLEARYADIMQNHWVLEYNNSPENTRTLALVFLFLSGIFALIFLILQIRKKLKKAKSSTTADV